MTDVRSWWICTEEMNGDFEKDDLIAVRDLDEITPLVETIEVVSKSDYDLLFAKAERLVGALHKIADPRLRDHKEPDKYTEVGCMIHMAEQALEEWNKK